MKKEGIAVGDSCIKENEVILLSHNCTQQKLKAAPIDKMNVASGSNHDSSIAAVLVAENIQGSRRLPSGNWVSCNHSCNNL